MAVQLEKMTVHQELLLEMLKDFDAVCRRHHISYQLFAGTALGAVRHHGFIPWDDDIDVILIRSEYQRFLTRPLVTLTRKFIMYSRSTARIGRCPFPSYGGTTPPV